MATQTLLQEHTLALTGMVQRWDRWLRLHQTLLWLPRSLMPGLMIGLLVEAVSRARPWLIPQQVALITGALAALGVALFALAVWLWRRPALTSARRFDVQFRLGERVSTALELGTGAIHSNDELAQRQIADARVRASAVRVREHIPLTLSRRDWAVVLILALVLALLLILPNPQVDALSQASIQQAAINAAAEQLRETTQDVAADTSLGNEERQTLLEQLKTATNTLEQPNVTPEEALAAVSDVQADLRDEADNLDRQAGASQAALEQAAASLQAANALRQSGGAGSDESLSETMESINQSLDQMAQNAQSMSEAQRQQAAEALQQAANALQNSNPQAAQSLEQSAQQMQQNQMQQVQQNMQQAQEQMQQQAQQSQQQQQSAQNLNNAAQQAQQSGQQISQSQQSQQAQANQQGQQQGQQGQQGQQQSQQQGQQQSQQQGQPNQQGQQRQQGQQSGDANSSQQAQAMQGIPGQGEQQAQSNQSGDQQSGGLSAGDQPGSQTGDDASQQAGINDFSDANNNPDGQGEGQFESVNVPRRIGDQPNDGNNIQLDPDASNAPVQEGDFAENPTGQVTVPYDQVFSDYADAANRALDSDYVPLGLRDVVRDYFTSLEPRR